MAIGAFIDRVLARTLAETPSVSLLAPDAVQGAIYEGATGVAFFFAEMGRLRESERGRTEFLARAHDWLDLARAWNDRATPSDWSDLHRGFIHGVTGIAYVDALLGVATGDPSRAIAAARTIARAADRFDDLAPIIRHSSIHGGEAGVVLATRTLLARLPESAAYASAREVLQQVHDRCLASLLAVHAAPFDSSPDLLLGMANGVAGELFVLVTAGAVDHPHVRARLAELAELRQHDPNGRTYWLSQRETDKASLLGSWCNGMAGQTLLWCEVARRTRDAEASALAEASARSTEFLMGGGVGICCGLAGQSIALQRFADVSGEARFSKRAYARLVRGGEIAEAMGGPLGFWKGELGVALVGEARRRGERGWPCVEGPEG